MFKKYLPFLRASIINIFIYRGRIILWVFVDIFRFVMMLFLWIAVYRNNANLNGFSFHEILLYFSLVGVTSIFSSSEVQYLMAEEIRMGTLSYYLVKPIKYKTRLIFINIGSMIGYIFIILPFTIVSMAAVIFIFKIQFSVTFFQVISFIMYLPLIMLFIFEFSFLFGNLMVYTENNFGLSILNGVLIRALSGALVPLAFYPKGFLKIIQYLPFRYLTHPVLIILDKIESKEIFTGMIALIGWTILFKIINYIVYKLSLKRMVVFGG